MTIRYCRSTSTFTDGLSWAGAYQTLAAAVTAASAGDTIYVSQAHSEANTTTQTINKTAPGNPVRIICASDDNEPPIATSTGGLLSNTVVTNIYGDLFIYGLTFKATGAGGNGAFGLGNSNAGVTEFESCTFWQSASSGIAIQYIGSTASANAHCYPYFRKCTFKFGAVGGYIQLGRCVRMDECVLPDSGGAIPTVLFPRDSTYTGGTSSTYTFMGCDFSALGSGKTLIGNPTTMDFFYLIDCKLNASVTLTGTISDNASGELFLKNSGSANNNYQYAVRKYCGSIDIDTTQYITLTSEAGASDGDIGYSWKMTGNANTTKYQPLRSEWIYMRYGTTGAAKTATIEVLYDGAANLKDDEVWIELGALTDSASPLVTTVSDRCGHIATAADQDAGLGIDHWTKGTAGTGWISQKLVSPSFTPQKKGYVMARVCVGVNKTVYVNPNLVIA